MADDLKGTRVRIHGAPIGVVFRRFVAAHDGGFTIRPAVQKGVWHFGWDGLPREVMGGASAPFPATVDPEDLAQLRRRYLFADETARPAAAGAL